MAASGFHGIRCCLIRSEWAVLDLPVVLILVTERAAVSPSQMRVASIDIERE